MADVEAVKFYGEMSLFNEEPRSATVEALSEDVPVYAVGRPNVKLILSNPLWGELLVSRFGGDLANTNNQITASSQKVERLKREKESLEDQIQQNEDAQIEYLAKVAKVFSGLIRFQTIIQDEAIVGSRGWAYLKALNNITLLLIRNNVPEILKYRKPADIEMLEVCLSQLGSSLPRAHTITMLDSLPDEGVEV